MNGSENRTAARILRRLKSSRAAVFLEFALIAPLALMVTCFGVDLCRLLVVEQQLEIASRLTADIESHYQHDKNTASPDSSTKKIVANYMQEALGAADNKCYYNQVVVENVPGPLALLAEAFDWAEPTSDDVWILKVLKWVLKTAVAIAMGGTDQYLAQLAYCDKMVGATGAVKYWTLLPKSCYAFFTNFSATALIIAKTQYRNETTNEKVDRGHREKMYCWMPLMDTVEFPPQTWIRKFEKNLGNSWFMTFLNKIGLDRNDFTVEVDE